MTLTMKMKEKKNKQGKTTVSQNLRVRAAGSKEIVL
jgi:hypothetical protein